MRRSPSTQLRRLLLVGSSLVVALAGTLWWMARGATEAPGRLGGDFHALQVLPGGRLLYGQHAGVSVSEDGGRTWGPPNGVGDAMTLASTPGAGDVVMAGHDVLKVSRDGGLSWSKVSFGSLASTDLHGFGMVPAQPNLWYANIAGLGLYRTANARTWQVVAPDTAFATTLAIGPGPRLYALIPGEGLIVSEGGVRWQPDPTAPPAAPTGLAVQQRSGRVYLAGPRGVWRSSAGAGAWTPLGFRGGARLIAADPVDESRLYLVNESGVVYRSIDGGQSWHPAA